MSFAKPSFKFVFFVIFVGVVAFAMFNYRKISDYIILANYQPSEEISSIAISAGMSQAGRDLFYLANPQILAADEFNKICDRKEAGSAILGCFDGQSIYLYKVSQPELAGVVEVTAAHEMLHKAWQRLSSAKKKRVSEALEEAYRSNETDEFKERMAYYERQQPGERLNELHSIIGTEIAALSPDLEDYYKTYFDNRAAVVGLHSEYRAVFDDLKKQLDDLQAKIESQTNSLNKDVAEYNQAIKDYNARVARHNSRLSEVSQAGSQAVSEFNRLGDQLRVAANDFAAKRQDILQRKAELEEKISQYNSAALRSNRLSASIDSLGTTDF